MTPADTVLPRVPLSLRLPSSVVESVGNYAEKHCVSKTDAFLYFLQKGMASEESAALKDQLDDIREELARIKTMLSVKPVATDDEAKAVHRAITLASTEFSAIKRAYLFGSFARGTYGDQSDIDVRLEIDREIPFNLHDLARFEKVVEQATERSVDVVSAERLKNANLAAAIEREKVLVYERQK